MDEGMPLEETRTVLMELRAGSKCEGANAFTQ